MNFFQWKQFTFFVILNVIVVRSENALFTESQLTIDAIEKALMFLQNHPKSLTDDVIFGVLIARSNLQWIINRLLTLDEVILKKLANLMNNCNHIVSTVKTKNRFLSNENVWTKEAKDFKRISSLEHEQLPLPELKSCQSINNYMMAGTPENSDFCIDELFKFNCTVSDYCWNSEMKKEFHSGYKTTHRLIYLQAASELECEKINPKKFSVLDAQKENLCEQILLEARMLNESPLFLSVRDLFMEQVALCGFEGFEDFAKSDWRREIRSWQSNDGCFGEDFAFTDCLPNPHNLAKRADSVINSCHTHLTAVAISALTFHLRFLFKNLFLLI